MKRYYVGLSTSGHDPALALVDDRGSLLFAEATERILQLKRAWGLAPDQPALLRYVLAEHCEAGDEFVVATSWTRLKVNGPTQVTDGLLPASDGSWLRNQHQRAHEHAGDSLAQHFGSSAPGQRRDFEHHLCHAAFACHSSPFSDAVCLVLDGEGDVGAVSLYRFAQGQLSRVWRSWGPGSLGAFYGWLTGACGFDWKAGEEWKVMGLAAFGAPRASMVSVMSRMLVMDRGRPQLPKAADLEAALHEMLSYRRQAGTSPLQAADLAASGQQVYAAFADSVVASCTGHGTKNLILTGGCALNSSYNGTILGRHDFEAVHVPCAPGDDGNAVGAALLAWLQDHPGQPLPRATAGRAGSAMLGCTVDARDVAAVVQNAGSLRVTEIGQAATDRLAALLAEGKIAGVMRGKAEFGPRALGNRSILADPRPAAMKDRLNRAVKGREPYRPFAPIVPAARVSDWFHGAQASPYMSFALRWREMMIERVPAVVHRDGTGRVQTVEPDTDAWLYALLQQFEARAGVPILLNTSFNVMGKPMVHSVQDAMAVLMTTGLDAVMFDSILVEKQGVAG